MQEHIQRRQTLLSYMNPGSLLILTAASTKWRTKTVEYPFRQENNFYYLTGIKEPAAVLILIKHSNGHCQSYLFLKSSTLEDEVWTGKTLSILEASTLYGFDLAYPLLELEKKLMLFLLDQKILYYCFGYHKRLDKYIIHTLKIIREKKYKSEGTIEIQDPLPWIHEMRLLKNTMEIELLRKATAISSNAHVRLMQYCKPGIMEYQMEAEFIHFCYQQGCSAVAYNSIVGGGENACILHYTNNNQPLKDTQLVLVDAGGEYQYYAADITRTYPINGRFSATQKALYQVVLKAQTTAIEMIKPSLRWNQLQECIVKILVEGLKELGILQGNTDDLISNKSYLPFYMHSSGHWLGLDVHDPGQYQLGKQSRLLEKNMVFTVEPGLYIRPDPKVDERWWNVGIRIEDNILVTETGYEVLTIQAPKSIIDIECIMR